MTKRMGSTTMAAVLGVAGLAGMGVGGYSLMTGTTVCEMLHGTCSTAIACPESGGCDSKPVETTTVVEVVNTPAASGEAKAGSCCALMALTVAKTGGSCHTASACSTSASSMKFVVMGANMPVVMPAAFYRPASSFSTDSLVSKSACATSCGDKSAALVINAANTTKTDEGCCKGTGVRADGKDCCGGCDTKEAASTTVPAANTKSSAGCCEGAKGCDSAKKPEQTANAGQ